MQSADSSAMQFQSLLRFSSSVFICVHPWFQRFSHARNRRQIPEQDAAQLEGADAAADERPLAGDAVQYFGPGGGAAPRLWIFTRERERWASRRSAGARAHAIFVEQHAPAVALIRRNLESLGIGAEAEILGMDVVRGSNGWRRATFTRNLFFSIRRTPPIAEYESALEVLGESPLVAPGGRVIVEHLRKRELAGARGRTGACSRRRAGRRGAQFLQACAGGVGRSSSRVVVQLVAGFCVKLRPKPSPEASVLFLEQIFQGVHVVLSEALAGWRGRGRRTRCRWTARRNSGRPCPASLSGSRSFLQARTAR